MPDKFVSFDKLHICLLKSSSGLLVHSFCCSCWSDCFDEVRKFFCEDFGFHLLEYYDLFEIGFVSESGIVTYDEPDLIYVGRDLRKKILHDYACCYFDEFTTED